MLAAHISNVMKHETAGQDDGRHLRQGRSLGGVGPRQRFRSTLGALRRQQMVYPDRDSSSALFERRCDMTGDAKLLRLAAEFKAADDRRRNATARTAEIEAELDRLGSRIRKAEKKEAKKAAATARAFNRVMNTRAKSLEGLLAKVKVRRRWNIDDEASELQILKSL